MEGMKTHIIYASAIVLSALILGFFYALANHCERIVVLDSLGNNRGCTYSRWTGKTIKTSASTAIDTAVSLP